MNLHRRKKGFTLIEMLIVIAIIGILASIVLVGLGPVQRRGRDARRISDLKQVQNALELYFNKCGYYPGASEGGSACGPFNGAPSTWDNLTAALTGSNIGVRQIPDDPSSGGGANAARNYRYAADATGSSYVLAATLEDAENPALRDGMTGSVYGITCGGTVYCIQF